MNDRLAALLLGAPTNRRRVELYFPPLDGETSHSYSLPWPCRIVARKAHAGAEIVVLEVLEEHWQAHRRALLEQEGVVTDG